MTEICKVWTVSGTMRTDSSLNLTGCLPVDVESEMVKERDTMKFTLGGKEHERIEVDVAGYEREPVGEFYSDNLLPVTVSVKVGGFFGRFTAEFMSGDFSSFLTQLNDLYDTLSGTAEFNTIEGQLFLVAEGDGKGHIDVHGEARDGVGTGNQLLFELELDQTQLAKTIKELKNIVAEYPLRNE